jgi:predicted dehydrogenase
LICCGSYVAKSVLFKPSFEDRHATGRTTFRWDFDSPAVLSAALPLAGAPGRRAPGRNFLRLAGAKGVVTVDDVQHSVTFWQTTPDDAQCFQPNYFAGGNRFYDSLTAHLEAFIAALAAGRRAPVTAKDGWTGLRLIEAAIESDSTGRRVKISPTRESNLP